MSAAAPVNCLAALLELQPHLDGPCSTCPQVVARAVEHERLTTIGGDAFREVPSGFDTYLLVNVLHDWNDDDAGKILDCVARRPRRDTGSHHRRRQRTNSDTAATTSP